MPDPTEPSPELKNRRRNQPSPRSGRSARRPPPPPPPPDSLVQLLQNDPSVLQYFQSLQANLEADVEIWKKRANEWKEQYEHLQNEKDGTTSKPRGRQGSSARKPNSQKKLKKPPAEALPPAASTVDGDANIILEQGEPIQDSMFEELELDLSSSEEEGEDKQQLEKNSENAQVAADKTGRKVLCFLKEAYEAFGVLGISLTKLVPDGKSKTRQAQASKAPTHQKQGDKQEEKNEGEGYRDNGENSSNSNGDDVMVLVPRSNQEVAANILSSLHNATRVQLLLMHDDKELCMKYAPFDPNRLLLPACDSNHSSVMNANKSNDDGGPCHPAFQSKRLLFRALLILDTFCSARSSDTAWNCLFEIEGAGSANPGSDYSHAMRVGLRNRKDLVRQLVDSLHGEICEAWACMDRTAWYTNTGLHLQPTVAAIDNNFSSSPLDGSESQEASTPVLMGGQKSQPRLSLLLERCWIAQLVVGIHLSRDDNSSASDLVLRYLLSTLPALQLEDYPKLSPVLSLVVLRGLLQPNDQLLGGTATKDNEDSSSWFIRHLKSQILQNDCKSKEAFDSFRRVLSLCIHHTALIWKVRLQHGSDARIHDNAQVELASYRDLLVSEAAWLVATDTCDHMDLRSAEQLIPKMCAVVEKELHSVQKAFSSADTTVLPILSNSLRLALVLHGNLELTKSILNETLLIDERSSLRLVLDARQATATTGAQAYRQLVLRQLDLYQERIGQRPDGHSIVPPMLLDGSIVNRLMNLAPRSAIFWKLAATVLECAELVADGKTALDTLDVVLHRKTGQDVVGKGLSSHEEAVSLRKLYDSIQRTASTPTVRVINLQRRTDRMSAFLAQALRENLLVVLAVAQVQEDEARPTNEEGYYCGRHAFDGLGRLAVVHARLSKQVGGFSGINALVNSQWCPNDLKPFDKDAPNDEGLVRMTGSEVACALSHVASWKGALRSFKLVQPHNDRNGGDGYANKLFRHPLYLRRLFQIAGFAEGPALLSRNSHMPPSPVCVILEDDAVLVDRFTERLAELLAQLPRDFHFCSLGYGRPKSAPILPYNDTCIGIPSHLFYMTGYILSAAGAEHLLESLPVVGPVDSWIGLKMTNNWDNIYGTALGVGGGTQQRPNSDLPARKDLCRILQFRAFCALQPLCSQRISSTISSSAAAAGGRSWRQRDTDVEYSGDHATMRRSKRSRSS